jgi:hypothetical protein
MSSGAYCFGLKKIRMEKIIVYAIGRSGEFEFMANPLPNGHPLQVINSESKSGINIFLGQCIF